MLQQYPILWKPTEEQKNDSNLRKYQNWLSENKGLDFSDYEELWQWSVDELAEFWESISLFFEVIWHKPYDSILVDNGMPDVKWFTGGQLNYAEHILRNRTDERPILQFKNEQTEYSMSWSAFEQRVKDVQAFMMEAGISKGDRVAAYLPHIPEALICFVAASALGAIWSSCSPDFGEETVVQRFSQISPKLLITVDGYQYQGKQYDRTETVNRIRERIPSLESTLFIPYIDSQSQFDNAVNYQDIEATGLDEVKIVPLDFDHPIWVVYSSGTTGKPKPITHSHGGALLEHLKYMPLHNDVNTGDNYFWFTTTGWIMWNISMSSILAGAVYVMYEGSPGFPGLDVLWRWAEKLPIHHFGTSPSFLSACKKEGMDLRKDLKLDKMISLSSTGAPLTEELFEWVYTQLPDVWLVSMSGGTDVATAFVGGNVRKEVRRGLIQSRALGVALYAYNGNGEQIQESLGEMVIAKPMPSMPIYFWNDENQKRYKSSYFEIFPNQWRHGDWIIIANDGSLIVQGRSDSTLNRKGIRIGTAEIYNVVDNLPEVSDSIVLNFDKDGKDIMPLFVVLEEGVALTEDLTKKIRTEIRQKCSPRHVPDSVQSIKEVPYTLSGKKMEVPLKKLFMGFDIDKALNRDAMRNPDSIEEFIAIATNN